jgi:hypothetical protein
MLQWGVGLVVAAIAYWSYYYSLYYPRRMEGKESVNNDLESYKDYLKARKEFDETYFQDKDKATRAYLAYREFQNNKIIKVVICIGLLMIFASPFVG